MTKPQWLIDKLTTMDPTKRAEYEQEYLEMRQAHEDCTALLALEQLNGLIRDRVIGVAKRYQTAVYIVGRAGTGKTYTVRETLNALGDDAGWVYRNARMSPAALFELFDQYADSVIVIDDVPLLFSNKQAVQILMAALGGDPDKSRTITYSTKGDHRRTEFRGGLIALSNLPLKNDPLALAIKSRTVFLSHEPTDEMLIAKMRQLARKGYKGLSPDECMEVAEFVICESRRSDYRLDLRYYGKAVEDYLYCQENVAHSDWHALVQSSLHTFAQAEAGAQKHTRAGQIEAERKIATELATKYPHPTPEQTEERNREWRERTGKSTDAYYRRLKELKG
jgi:hypothetical protein